MRFLAVDDEIYILEEMVKILRRVQPKTEVLSFTRPDEAIRAAERQTIDVAFLDIHLGKMSGLELAVRLKNIKPDMHIIFVTGYQEYAVDAFRMHATGYLLKPVDENDVKRELTFIYEEAPQRKRISVQTFGGFELFVDGRPVHFGRAKSKELLAYLVDHRGAVVTAAEARAALFEEMGNTGTSKSYFHQLVYELKNALKKAGASEILTKGFNGYAVVPEKFDCDYYRLLQGDPIAINQYQNDYMPLYSWGEAHNAELWLKHVYATPPE